MRLVKVISKDDTTIAIEYEKDGKNHLLVTTLYAIVKDHEATQQIQQRKTVPHEHLQAEFDYICAGCGKLVKHRR